MQNYAACVEHQAEDGSPTISESVRESGADTTTTRGTGNNTDRLFNIDTRDTFLGKGTEHSWKSLGEMHTLITVLKKY